MICDQNIKTVLKLVRYVGRSLTNCAALNKPKAGNFHFHKLVGKDNNATFGVKDKRLC